jgi:hypothetical protein
VPTEFVSLHGRGVLRALQGGLLPPSGSILLLDEPSCDQTVEYNIEPARINSRMRDEDVGRSFDFRHFASLSPSYVPCSRECAVWRQPEYATHGQGPPQRPVLVPWRTSLRAAHHSGNKSLLGGGAATASSLTCPSWRAIVKSEVWALDTSFEVKVVGTG